jgi:hypothetical protein
MHKLKLESIQTYGSAIFIILSKGFFIIFVPDFYRRNISIEIPRKGNLPRFPFPGLFPSKGRNSLKALSAQVSFFYPQLTDPSI